MEGKISFVRWLGQKKSLFIKEGLFAAIFFVTFALYHLPLAAVLYPVLLCFFTGMLFLIWDYRKFAARHERLQQLSEMPFDVMTDFPEAASALEKDYQQMIEHLREGQRQMQNEMAFQYQDMIDYYTVWAHQIKTPIAAMRLTLQNTDSSLSRKLSVELARVEQYVDMVLCYLRLDTDTRDYVFAAYDLDDILRQALRKFAGQFIGKKIHLDYQPLNTQVMTDEKWLLFVIEQILSNALKYTQQGRVSIYLESPKTLCIRDTGMGIASEDLPRIFEKGYTGYNGRRDKKASGLGLYLCARICHNLGHGISAESELDKGTVIKLNLNTAARMFE